MLDKKARMRVDKVLTAAAGRGLVDVLRFVLEDLPSLPNRSFSLHWRMAFPALQMAALNGREDAFDTLLTQIDLPDCHDIRQRGDVVSLLSSAAQGGSVAILNKVMEKVGAVDIVNAVDEGVFYQQPSIALWYIENKGGDATLLSGKGNNSSILHIALEREEPSATIILPLIHHIQTVLSSSPSNMTKKDRMQDMNHLDDRGLSPLMIAASKGMVDTVDALIQAGASLDILSR
jgi:hypothetical protein